MKGGLSRVDLVWMGVVGFVAGSCACGLLWAGAVLERQEDARRAALEGRSEQTDLGLPGERRAQ